MKGLFVVFHGFSAHSGISKKIFAQCDALRRQTVPDIELCHIEIAPDGTQRRMVGGQAIRTFGRDCPSSKKRVSAERHHALHPPRRGGVPLHPPRPQRQPGADPLAAQRSKNSACGSRWKSRPTLTTPNSRSRPRCGSSNCASTACSAAAWPATSTASSPSPTIRRYIGRRRSVSQRHRLREPPAQKPRYTGITTTYGCWPWRTSISGTASTA